MNGNAFVEELKRLVGYDIVFTKHAELRLVQRQIDRKAVTSSIRNPFSLKLVEKLPAVKNEEKYKLWFLPSRRIAHIYVIVINHLEKRIIVKTVIKQKLLWQKRVERHAK